MEKLAITATPGETALREMLGDKPRDTARQPMPDGTGAPASGPVRRPSSRNRILAAAVDLIGEVGAAKVSLEAVAERAGVSKGGLLYNFPTKTILLKALVAEHILDLDIRRADAEADLPDAVNTCARAYLAAGGIPCDEPRPTGFLAAIAEDPGLLDPLRAHHAALATRLRAAQDPTLSLIAFLAMEGMKLLDLFETDPLTPAEHAAVKARLDELLSQPPR